MNYWICAGRAYDGMKRYLDAARADLCNKPALFEALGRFRVLCAMRESLRGVAEINRFAAKHFRDALDHPLDPGSRSEWYPGRPVMVLRNDYVLKLFNGDVGIVLPDASDTLMMFFPESDGSFRAVAPLRLPEHETAFATTVHKAQGSEFDSVLLLLPATPNRVVTGELLYTAVTRWCHDRRRDRGAGEGDCFAYAEVFGVGGAVGGRARLTCSR